MCRVRTQHELGPQPERVREKISLTGQFAAVDGILTGRENLVLVARLRAVSNPTQVADSLLQQFGLGICLERPPANEQFVEDDAQAEYVAAAIDAMPFAAQTKYASGSALSEI